MTPEAADFLAHGEFGYGRGIVPVKYQESWYMAGDYTLFLQVERLDEPNPCRNVNSTFMGDSELRTSHPLATGPFPGHIDLMVSLTDCTSLRINGFEPIVSPPVTILIPGGGTTQNIVTVTLGSSENGVFNLRDRSLRIQLTLHFNIAWNTNPSSAYFFQASELPITLTGNIGADGTAVLTGSGTFAGGSLNGSTGTVRITGNFSPSL